MDHRVELTVRVEPLVWFVRGDVFERAEGDTVLRRSGRGRMERDEDRVVAAKVEIRHDAVGGVADEVVAEHVAVGAEDEAPRAEFVREASDDVVAIFALGGVAGRAGRAEEVA